MSEPVTNVARRVVAAAGPVDPNYTQEETVNPDDGGVNVHLAGGAPATQLSTTFGTGQQPVTASAAKLNGGTATAFENGLILKNLSTSSASLFYGEAGVTTSTGCEIPPGGSDVLPVADISTIYVVAASPSTATATWAGMN